MRRIRPPLLVQTGVIAAVLTSLVLIAEHVQILGFLDRWLYDLRVRHHQHFVKPATDRLVHVHIDDEALEEVGWWPLDRSRLAAIIDQIKDAGAKAIALDIILPDPQQFGAQGPPGPVHTSRSDLRLADAIGNAENVLLPVHFILKPLGPVHEAAVNLLRGDLTLDAASAREQLSRRPQLDSQAVDQTQDWFPVAKREAMYRSIRAQLEEADLPFPRLAPNLMGPGTGGPPGPDTATLLHKAYTRVQALSALERFLPRTDDGAFQLELGTGIDPLPPIVPFARAAAATASIVVVPDDDRVLRSIPLGIQHAGRLYPQLGLTLACMMLDVSLDDLQWEPDRIVIRPAAGPPIVIPVHRKFISALGQVVDLMLDIPWHGPLYNWERMYRQEQRLIASVPWAGCKLLDDRIVPDPVRSLLEREPGGLGLDAACVVTEPGRRWVIAARTGTYVVVRDQQTVHIHAQPPVQHLSVKDVMHYPHMIEQVERNHEKLDVAIGLLLHYLDEAERDRYESQLPEPHDLDTRLRQAVRTRTVAAEIFAEMLEADPAELRLEDRNLIRAVRQLTQIPQVNSRLLAKWHTIHRGLNGRAVIVGWAATGVVADFWPTPLHPHCPGPLVSGAIYNAVMTGDLWQQASGWIGVLVTIGMGLCAAAAVAWGSPWQSAAATGTTLVLYYLVNGAVLFDYANTIVPLAATVTVAPLVWTGCTLHRFVVERATRQRIERRFSTYADRALVDYVLAHPQETRFEGQVKELTVVFTDLAGFTRLTEKLQAQSVSILNRYMELMVPIIEQHHGYLNKFLGDGLMCFFGAPRANTQHAADAVGAVLAMGKALEAYNATLADQGLPNVAMRAGICTGPMVVGDAGSPRRSDYTVLGDAVNVAARLEKANKATGTTTLINDRAAELVKERFLLCPVGRLQLPGKQEAVMSHEPLCPAGDTTAQDRANAASWQQLVDTYLHGDFGACLQHCTRIAQTDPGRSALIDRYRMASQHHLANPPGDGFAGQIVLLDK